MPVKLPLIAPVLVPVSHNPLKSPGSSHPLDRLSMDISRSQSVNALRTYRDIQKHQNDTLAKAEVVSASLARHGKRLFDDAVCRFGRGDAGTSTGRRRYRTWHYGAQRCYSGPTHLGSPLYNKRSKLMNEIRTRTKKFNQDGYRERSQTLPSIEQTINKYGGEFRVVTTTWDFDGTDYKPCDTILVRIDVDNDACADDGAARAHDFTCPALTGRRLASEGTCSRKSEQESVVDDGAKSLDSKLVDNEVREHPGAEKSVNFNEEIEQKENETPVLEEVQVAETQPRVSQVKDTGTRPRSTPKDPRTNSRTSLKRKGSRLNNKNAKEPPPSDDEEEDVRPYFKCWVDDVSVSSIAQPEVVNDLNNSNVPNDLANGVAKIALDKTTEVVVNGAVADGQQEPPPIDGGVGPTDGDKTVIDLQDLQECEWTFPDFVCPSSEEKSKEVATKDWVMNTNFTVADKSVPLV